MELIDTHCHIDVADFDADRNEVIAHARQLGVSRMIVPAITADGWDHLLQICHAHQGLYPALGLHPIYQGQHEEIHLQQLQTYVNRERPLAIGEIGLDFYIEDADRDRQLYFFEAQLEIARQFDLPVILHVRKAHEQVLSSLQRIKVKGGISHAFNGSLQQAQQYIALGFKLGFGGMLTYERSSKLRKLAQALPLESLVLETDAPDMSGAAHRGQRNSPEYLPEHLHALAQLRGLSEEAMAEQTCRNSRAIFTLD